MFNKNPTLILLRTVTIKTATYSYFLVQETRTSRHNKAAVAIQVCILISIFFTGDLQLFVGHNAIAWSDKLIPSKNECIFLLPDRSASDIRYVLFFLSSFLFDSPFTYFFHSVNWPCETNVHMKPNRHLVRSRPFTFTWLVPLLLQVTGWLITLTQWSPGGQSQNLQSLATEEVDKGEQNADKKLRIMTVHIDTFVFTFCVYVGVCDFFFFSFFLLCLLDNPNKIVTLLA